MNGSSYDYHALALAPVLALDPVVMPCSSFDPLLRFWHRRFWHSESEVSWATSTRRAYDTASFARF
jgi:hypothetical protein